MCIQWSSVRCRMLTIVYLVWECSMYLHITTVVYAVFCNFVCANYWKRSHLLDSSTWVLHVIHLSFSVECSSHHQPKMSSKHKKHKLVQRPQTSGCPLHSASKLYWLQVTHIIYVICIYLPRIDPKDRKQKTWRKRVCFLWPAWGRCARPSDGDVGLCTSSARGVFVKGDGDSLAAWAVSMRNHGKSIKGMSKEYAPTESPIHFQYQEHILDNHGWPWFAWCYWCSQWPLCENLVLVCVAWKTK